MSATRENDLMDCPACGGQDWNHDGQVKDYSISGEWFDLILCTICHFKVTKPKPSETEISRYYVSENYVSHSDTKNGLINKMYHTARNYMLKKKLKWVIDATGKSIGSLLDIGAGTGHFAHYMKLSGWQVEALEPDEKARKVAAEKLNMTIGPIEHLSELPSKKYDAITLWHVLEHVHNLKGYLEHFRNLLKPGGVLIIAVPNHMSSDAKKYKFNWAAYDVPRHLWHFSPEAMDNILRRSDFDLTNKLPMHLDAFYVSMLSEKYKGSGLFGNLTAMISGLKTYIAVKKNVNNASSIIYIAK